MVMDDLFHGKSKSPPAPRLGRGEGGRKEVADGPGQFHELCRDFSRVLGVFRSYGLLVVNEMSPDEGRPDHLLVAIGKKCSVARNHRNRLIAVRSRWPGFWLCCGPWRR